MTEGREVKRGLGPEAGAGEEGSAPEGGLGGSARRIRSPPPLLNGHRRKDEGGEETGRRMRATWRCRSDEKKDAVPRT